MFVILFYDVNQKRCGKMLKVCRKYLQWIQNSVFEGEMSLASYEELVADIKDIICEDEGDSVVIYKFRKMKFFDRIVYGEDKKDDIQFI